MATAIKAVAIFFTAIFVLKFSSQALLQFFDGVGDKGYMVADTFEV